MECKPLLTVDAVKKELTHIHKHSSMTQVVPININGELIIEPLLHYQLHQIWHNSTILLQFKNKILP
jgi:hypothetical protein